MAYPPIDFTGLAAALLERAHTLVPQWLPYGEREGKYWYVGDFDGNAGHSANVNLDSGAWGDNGGDGDSGGDLTSLYARIHGLGNGQAARQIMREMGWERSQASAHVPGAAVPPSGRPEPPPADDGPAAVDQSGKRIEKWRPIVPVPRHAPRPEYFRHGFKNRKTGDWTDLRSVRHWAYEFEGELYGYVARFERVSSDGELVKDTIPFTWCEDTTTERGLQGWHAKTWPAPRPLYVPAALLSGDPSTVPVVIVEGEKCAEAGFRLLGHEFDFVCWPGGAKTWAMARWGTLLGRTVYLWPDCDAQRERPTREERERPDFDPSTKPIRPAHKQPGMQAMVNIGSLLMADHGCTVHICQIPKPGAVGDGWDIADAIAEGWDADQVRAFIRAAVPFVPPSNEAVAKAGGSISTPSRAGAGSGGGGNGGHDAAGGADDPNRAWRRHLVTTGKEGKIVAVRENICLALDGWPENGVPGIPEVHGVIAFNEFTNNVEKRRDTPWGTKAGVWLEEDELLMGQWLLREYWLPSMSRQTLEEAVSMVARRHAYHPVRERVTGYRGQWDGTKRLASWLERCCLDPKDPQLNDPLFRKYLARAGTWFLMAMCARVMPEVRDAKGNLVCGPGTKFDYMLILEGPQSAGKSSLASLLGGQYFSDTGLDIGQKDSYQNIQGIWVYEWGELENLTRQEVGKVKLFVSSPKDRFRASFDKRPRDYPRQVVFFGTTNEAHYLTDVTGNRRFWPLRISRPPDRAWLQDNLEQLLAEAVHYVDQGERFYPNREEQKTLFDPQQRARTVESSIEGAIRAYLYDEDQKVPLGGSNGAFVPEISMCDLLTRIGYTMDRQTDAVVKRASAVLHMLGWQIGKRSSKPGRPRLYVRPAVLPEDLRTAGDSFLAPDAGQSPAGDDSDIPF